jgi:uncharacterized Zn finger protein
MYYDFYYRPYVSVAARQLKAEQALARLRKQGRQVSPVRPAGRNPATTFWGKAWCTNLQSYSDYSNRLPRGTSYLRNGAVLDLQVSAGKVEALVQGTDLYRVNVTIEPLAEARWKPIVEECAGKIDSVIELLRGKLSKAVMEVLVDRERGLFPAPKEIRLECSCPDYAGLCKHLAAALYGVGTRLDEKPELLFTLRQVNQDELVARAGQAQTMLIVPSSARLLESDDLSNLFGIDLEGPAPEASAPERRAQTPAPQAAEPTPARARPVAVRKKPARTKPARTAIKPARAKPAAARAAAGSSRKKPARARANQVPTVSAAELKALGIARGTIRAWLGEGFLIPTADRDRYETTPAAEVRMLRRRKSLQP